MLKLKCPFCDSEYGLTEPHSCLGMTMAGRLSAFKSAKPDLHSPEEMVLLLSDLQPGLRTETYNVDEFVARMRRLTSAVIRLREIHAADRAIETLHIAALGDFVEGEPFTHRINLSEMATKDDRPFDILAQKRLVVEECSNLIEKCSTVFKRIRFTGVYGNHGAARSLDASKRSNDDTEIYYALADRFRGDSKVVFEIDPNRFYQILEVCGHKFLLVHGHQVRMWTRTPLYGIINIVTLWHQAIPDPFEYVLLGHFHALNYLNAVGTPVYLNGAFVDDDEYGMVRGLKATAAQWVSGVHPKYGAVWERRVWLKKEEK